MTCPALHREDGWQVIAPWPTRRAPFVAWGLGFDGWRSSRRPRLRQGWRYWNPYLHVGLLATPRRCRVWRPGEVRVPAVLFDGYLWATSADYREFCRKVKIERERIAASRAS